MILIDIVRVLLDLLRLVEWLGWLPAILDTLANVREWIESSFDWLFRWLSPFFTWVRDGINAILQSLAAIATTLQGFFDWLAGSIVGGFNAVIGGLVWLGDLLVAFFDWVVRLPGDMLWIVWDAIVNMMVSIASWLPAASPGDAAIWAPLTAVSQYTAAIAVINYFFDLPVAMGCVATVVSIEIILLLPRVWEWILKLVPLA